MIDVHWYAKRIMDTWDEDISKSWQAKMAQSNNASMIGDDCLNKLYLSRTRGNERTKPSLEVLRWFRRGNLDETRTRLELQKLNFDLVRDKRFFEWPHFQIRGKIDWKFLPDRKSSIVAEHKSVSPSMFATAQREHGDGKLRNKYLRKGNTQLNLYLAIKSKEKEEPGVMIYYEPLAHSIFVPVVELDLNVVEEACKKCEIVNDCMTKGEEPGRRDLAGEPIPWEDCMQCDFYHICLTPVMGGGATDISDEEIAKIEQLISTRTKLEQEFKSVIDEISGMREEGGGR